MPEGVTNCRQVSPQYLAPAFGNTVSAIKVADISNFRLRDMKGSDFTQF